jgi:hypothetical protein
LASAISVSASDEDYDMTAAKSPGAAAAGASVDDQLGRQVIAETNRQERFAQAPIRATLFGSKGCEAEGIVTRGYAPVLDLCRALIRAGHDPKRPLHAYRGARLALAVRSIGEGAQLTVEDDSGGTPHLRRWRPRRRHGAASPVAQTVTGRGIPAGAQRNIQRAAP